MWQLLVVTPSFDFCNLKKCIYYICCLTLSHFWTNLSQWWSGAKFWRIEWKQNCHMKKGDFTKEPFSGTCCLFYALMYVLTIDYLFRGIKIFYFYIFRYDLKVGKYLWVFPDRTFFERDLTLVSTDKYATANLSQSRTGPIFYPKFLWRIETQNLGKA